LSFRSNLQPKPALVVAGPIASKMSNVCSGFAAASLRSRSFWFLAEKDADPDFDEIHLPFELVELEPRHWTLQEKSKIEMDLN
jgi:hypothetical protein